MAKKRTQDLVRELENTAKHLREGLDRLGQQGHPASVDRGLDLLADHLELSTHALADVGRKAHAQARDLKDGLGRALRDRAGESGCDFAFKPPLVHFGCVTFRQDTRDADAWLVSSLGAEPLERILGHDPDGLARAALDVIESVETALSRVDPFLRDAAAAYELLIGSVGSIEGVSPNLLLLLTSKGKGLKKELVSADRPASAGLSRVQGGFLLRAASQLHESSGIRMRLRPATQHVTADVWRYMAVPDEPKPRNLVSHTPVGRVSFDREEIGR